MQSSRRHFLKSSLTGEHLGDARIAWRHEQPLAADAPSDLSCRVARDVPTRYFDGQHCWAHPRAGIVPQGGDG